MVLQSLPHLVVHSIFSTKVSESNVATVAAYIANQAEHHRKFMLQEGFVSF
jgi:hypothetical protein